MKIRQLDLSELDRLTEGAREFFSESSVFRGEFNPETFSVFWKDVYVADLGTIFVLVNDADEICAGIGCLAIPDFITGILASNEAFWYARKQFRGRGFSLVPRYEQWALKRGCRKIRLVHLIDLMPDKLARVYRKRGYSPIETTWEKEVA